MNDAALLAERPFRENVAPTFGRGVITQHKIGRTYDYSTPKYP